MRKACLVLRIRRNSLYRRRKQGSQSEAVKAAARARKSCFQPRALTKTEEDKVLAVLKSERFQDQPAREVYHRLLSEGNYLCSIRTMYRIAAKHKLNQDRRAQRAAQHHAVPRLKATAPNEVWCWDVTKFATYTPSVYLSLYAVMDLFSRFVVAWMLSTKENSGLAQQLMREAIGKYGVTPSTGLAVHQDRGSPMTAHRYLDMMHGELGVICTHSRPRVSNDNPHMESSFRTLKYQPDYPGRFHSVLDGRRWCEEYFQWYNLEHHHMGLTGFTPYEVFTGEYKEVLAQRQVALDDIYSRHPERFVKGCPKAKLPPAVVTINPYTEDELMQGVADQVNFPTLSYLKRLASG